MSSSTSEASTPVTTSPVIFTVLCGKGASTPSLMTKGSGEEKKSHQLFFRPLRNRGSSSPFSQRTMHPQRFVWMNSSWSSLNAPRHKDGCFCPSSMMCIHHRFGTKVGPMHKLWRNMRRGSMVIWARCKLGEMLCIEPLTCLAGISNKGVYLLTPSFVFPPFLLLLLLFQWCSYQYTRQIKYTCNSR